MGVTVVPQLPPPSNPATMPSSCPLVPVWYVTVLYDEDTGLRQAPICGPKGAKNRFNRVHGGKSVKIVKWVALGWGSKPPLPSWDTGQPNEVLMRRVRMLPVPGKSTDGADVLIYYGEYHYGLQTPIDDADTLTGACAPYQSSPSVTVFNLAPDDFQKAWVGPSLAAGGELHRLSINYPPPADVAAPTPGAITY